MKISDHNYYPLPTSLEELLADEQRLLTESNLLSNLEAIALDNISPLNEEASKKHIPKYSSRKLAIAKYN